MPNANQVTIMGNVTREPEVKFTTGGKAFCEISIAINRYWTTEGGEKKESTTFVAVSVWGKQAEIIGEYVSKGDPLYIEGHLTIDEWEDKESGQKRQKLKVTADQIQLIKSKPRDESTRSDNDGHESPARKFNPPPSKSSPTTPDPEDNLGKYIPNTPRRGADGVGGKEGL